MKKYFCLIFGLFVSLFISTNVHSFSDVDTHPKITKKAAEQSIIGCEDCKYLQNNLGFKKGLDEVVSSDKIVTILMNGAQTEDSGVLPAKPEKMCDRGLNHFYDPTKISGGLDETIYLYQVINNHNLYFLYHVLGGLVFVYKHFEGYENPSR